MERIESELIKFASANKLHNEHFLLDLDNETFNEIATAIKKDTCIRKHLLGVEKFHKEKKGFYRAEDITVKCTSTKLLETKLTGGIFARDFDYHNLSKALGEYSDIIKQHMGLQTIIVMMHPQGYTQSAKCNYFIGSMLNLLISEDASVSELIYFCYKLGTGLTSKQLSNENFDEEKIKQVLSSVLAPWTLTSSFCKSGFVNYGTPAGMFVDTKIIDNITNFDYTGFHNFNDLLFIKSKDFVYPSLEKARVKYGDLFTLVEKFIRKSSRLSCRYGYSDIYYVFNILKDLIKDKSLEEVKAMASDIRKQENFEREQWQSERQSRPVKPSKLIKGVFCNE